MCVCACLCTRKHALACGAGACRRAAARSAHTSVRIQPNRVWQGGRTCETPNVWCFAAGRKGRTSRSEWERAPLSVPAALCLAGPRPRSGVTRLWPGDAGARDSAGHVSRAPSSCPGDRVCLRRDSAPGPEPVSSPGRGRTRSGFGTSPSEPGKRNSCEGAPALSDSRAGGENSVVYIFIFLSYLQVYVPTEAHFLTLLFLNDRITGYPRIRQSQLRLSLPLSEGAWAALLGQTSRRDGRRTPGSSVCALGIVSPSFLTCQACSESGPRLPSTSTVAARTVPGDAAPLGTGAWYLHLPEFYNKFYIVQRASERLMIPTGLTSEGTARRDGEAAPESPLPTPEEGGGRHESPPTRRKALGTCGFEAGSCQQPLTPLLTASTS